MVTCQGDNFLHVLEVRFVSSCNNDHPRRQGILEVELQFKGRQRIMIAGSLCKAREEVRARNSLLEDGPLVAAAETAVFALLDADDNECPQSREPEIFKQDRLSVGLRRHCGVCSRSPRPESPRPIASGLQRS